MKTCTVDGCTTKHRARGYCRTHYDQTFIRTTGQPRAVVDIAIDDVEWMAETGEIWTNAVRRLGVKESTLERRLARAGRQDLITTMRARENGYAHSTSRSSKTTSPTPQEASTAA